MDNKETANSYIADNKIAGYFQPPAGNTEKYISILPVRCFDYTLSSYQALKNYTIKDIGQGLNAAEAILKHILVNKLNQKVVWKSDVWNKTVVIHIRCELKDRESGRYFDELKPVSLKDVSVDFAVNEGPERNKDIENYALKMKGNADMGFPVYVSGNVLNYIGGNVDPKGVYMIDGARRISASVLSHQREIAIQLLIHEDELAQLLKEKKVQALRDHIASIKWFNNYQSIPLVGLKGLRSLRRFDLMDMSMLQDQEIMDFGCNIGQTCVKSMQAGAWKVWGIEGMPDTWNLAGTIGQMTGFENLNYLNINFNDVNFDRVIDGYCPDKVDFSFFFSVYRTKELAQRDRLFNYIINKTKKGIFFEGHAHPKIDTVDYYDWLFESFGLKYRFLGHSEGNLRPLFYIPMDSFEIHSGNKTPVKSSDSINSNSLINSDSKGFLVSAIVSTYKSQKFMEGRLKDLLNQTIGERLEIIVVDSNSPENEKAIVERYMKDHKNLKYIRTEERETIYKAWNRGIHAASGKFITNANTDDRLRPDAFQIMADELEKNPETGLVYADFFITGYENMDFYGHIRSGYSIKPDYSPGIMLSGCHMGPQPMWRKSVHDEIGYFDDSFTSAGDYEFWCRLATSYPMRHIPDFLGLYLHNHSGIANSNLQTGSREAESVMQMYKDKFPPLDSEVPIGYYYKEKVSEGKYVNICMVTYNRLEFTKQAVASIVKQTRFPYVLTVVDNNSTDGTGEYLKELYKRGIIKNLVLLDRNIGVAKASNLAWQTEPDAEYYLKFDNDIVMQKHDWLANMVKIVDEFPEIGVLGYNFESASYPVITARNYSMRIKKQGNIGGACILIPKRTGKLLGRWCEDYGLYSEEDADYGYRVLQADKLNVYMENENAGFHLPSGKAAAIDPRTLAASDGIEEIHDRQYRLHKDYQRRNNISILNENIKGYISGTRPIYVSSAFTPDMFKDKVYSGGIPCPSDLPSFSQMMDLNINMERHGLIEKNNNNAKVADDMGIDISIVETKKGLPSMIVMGSDGSRKTLHSLYDPVADARNIVGGFQFNGKDLLIVLGLGLGYHIVELAQKFTDTEIVVVEAMPEVYELAMKHGPELDNKIKFIIGLSLNEVLRKIRQYQVKSDQEHISVFSLLPSVSAFPDYYRPILASLENELSVTKQDLMRNMAL